MHAPGYVREEFMADSAALDRKTAERDKARARRRGEAVAPGAASAAHAQSLTTPLAL
jgi:hypothetical protein